MDQSIGQSQSGERRMGNMFKEISSLLLQEYNLDVENVHQMTTGVGGDTFLVEALQGKFIYKIADANEMNHPETEPEICNYLFEKGIEVSAFLKNTSGNFMIRYSDNRVSHLQKYVAGSVFAMNEAPEWFMKETPVLLGRIHNELSGYKELPEGIGKAFFQYMTLDNAKRSYMHSYEIAKQSGETEILEDLEFRMSCT